MMPGLVAREHLVYLAAKGAGALAPGSGPILDAILRDVNNQLPATWT
ncbi:hypothetical protein [Nocardia beijingensis]|nr:hypothetical protein [Nocardia beijingensis]